MDARILVDAEPQPFRSERRHRRVRAGRRRADERGRGRGAAARSPSGRSARSRTARTSSTRSAPTSWRARTRLGRLLAREEGKTLPEGIGETVRAGHIFKFFAGEALRLAGEKLPSVRPGVEVEITREPVGVVGLITPWNFPIAIPAWKIAPGAGVRQHAWSSSPRSGRRVAPGRSRRSSPRAGIPAGCVQPGDGLGLGGRRNAREPSRRRRAQLHGLDGDRPRDRAEGDLAHGASSSSRWAARIRWSCSTMPTSTTAVNVALQGAYFSTGQRCTASSRLIVTDGIHDRFVEALTSELGVAARRQCADAGYRNRPGRRQAAARTGSRLHRGRPEGGRAAGRTAASG